MADHEASLRQVARSGFPFQLGVEAAIRQSHDNHGWSVASREHPWANPETGTSGFHDTPKVPHKIKIQRRRELMKLQAGISRNRNRALIGREMSVLIDGAENASLVGRLYHQAPDVDGCIKIKGGTAVAGEFVQAVITGAGEYDLTARPVEEA